MSEATEPRNETAVEVRRLRRLLNEMGKLAEQASLTGSLSDGASEAASTYNNILRRLDALGVAPGPLFSELPDDATFDRIGVASKLLSGYLEEDAEDERHESHVQPNIIIGGLGNLSHLGDMEKLRDLGQNIRENIADLIRGRGTEGEKARVAVRVESSLRRAEAAIADAEAAVAEAQSTEVRRDAPPEALPAPVVNDRA